MDAGRAGEGPEQFLQSVESDPTNPGAYYDLGQACLRHALAIADKITAETKTSPHSRRIFAENCGEVLSWQKVEWEILAAGRLALCD
jgi:hypothetical protein